MAGDSDFAPGLVRFSFLVIRHDARPVERPLARVWLARSRAAHPFERATARLEAIGPPGRGESAFGGVGRIYVVELLLRYSIAGSLAAHRPFVVTFATPRYCTSRTCGPVVDVVNYVRRRLAARGVRFIHVEVYTQNRPVLGYNRWMRQWGLRSEPWTFLVGRDGRIKAKFEGSVSARELEAAVRRLLL